MTSNTLEVSNRLERVRAHLDRWLGAYVGLMIVLGLVAGYYSIGWVRYHEQLLNMVMMASIYIMIFPMLLMLNIRALGNAFRNYKLTTAVVLLNFVYSPLMAVLLGLLFVPSPFVRFGLFLAWVVPCSSMSIGYVGLMMADISAATAMVALSFILSLALIPAESSAYISMFLTHVRGLTLSGAVLGKVEMNLVMTIIEVLIIPLVLAIPTREAMIRRMGQAGFRRISPLFPSITMIGMMIIIFTIFFAHAGVLITHMMDVLGIFYSAMVFGSVSLAVFTLLFKYVKLNRRGESPYDPAMVAILTGIPKNEATAIALSAVALAPLGSGIAFLASMPPSLLPAFQVVFIITFLKLRDRVMNFYGVRREREAIKVPVEEGAKVSARGIAEEGAFEIESMVGKPGLNVLIPVDLSRDTERWVIEGLSRLSNVSSVTLLYVVPLNLSEVSEFITENVIAEGKKVAEGKLINLINIIKSSKIIEINNININYEAAVGDPASIIIDYASTGKFDLVMMGHRPHIIGSVALKVVARSPIPVLIIRRAE